MATIKDVRAWREHKGVGHVVASSSSGWEHWLCGTFTPGKPPYPKRVPKKLCRECMKRLAEATVKEAV